MVCAAAALIFAFAAFAARVVERVALSWYRVWTSLPVRQFVWRTIGMATTARLLVAMLPASSALPADPAAGDIHWYHETAVALASGAGLSFDGAPTAYRPPGYSFLLSLTYGLAGPHPQLAWFWGTLATALLLFSAHGAASLLYGPAVARVATLCLAVYPALALATGQTMSDLVFAAGLTAILHYVLAGGARSAPSLLVTGVMLGLVTLVRSVGLAMVVPVLFIVLVDRGARSAAVIVLPFLVGLAAPLCLWALRNHSVFGQFALDTNTGFNLLVGNHPGASGGFSFDQASRSFAPPAYNLSEVGLDRVFASRAISFIFSNPGEWVRSWPKKLVQLFALELWAARGAFPADTRALALKYGLYAFCQLSYTGLFTLFCARLLSFADPEQRPRHRQWVGFLVGAALASVALVTFGLDRYRLPFLPWMIIEASVAYCGFCSSRESGNKKRALDGGGIKPETTTAPLHP
jgi:4-amino-4-deoxy-L-arabinose transferase-like glycosyltransferase